MSGNVRDFLANLGGGISAIHGARGRHEPRPGMAGQVQMRREAKGWSKAQLAAEARINVDVISRLERGKARPKRRNLEAVAAALGVSVEQLQEGA